MESKNSTIYLLTINLNIGGQSGIDLQSLVQKVDQHLRDYIYSTKCLHKFKVTGEARIVAVFEVFNVTGLERTISGLAGLGNVDVTCKPLKPYEKFAKMLGCDDSLTEPFTRTMAYSKQNLFWLTFNVEYPGKSIDELLATWKNEAEFALGARNSGVHLELFKVLCERKVILFIRRDADSLDDLIWNLPVMKENGNGVTVLCHGIQNLHNYCCDKQGNN